VLDINGVDIEINKNNSGVFTIHMTGDDVPDDSTEVHFVVKRTPDFSAHLIHKVLLPVDGVLTVEIDKEDTSGLAVGDYYWNIIIQFDGGDQPWTVLKNAGRFIVLPEIGGS